MKTRDRGVRLGLVVAAVAATTTLGALQKAPCAAEPGGSHGFLCASDISVALKAEQLTGGRLPYLDACVPASLPCDEYPVLTMYFMRAGAWVSGADPTTFFWASAAPLIALALLVALLLWALVGGRALYFAIAPTLLLSGILNWDLLAVAFVTAGLLAFLRGREAAAGAFLGLGAAAKVFPAFFVLPLAVERVRKGDRPGALRLAMAAAGSWIALNLPFAIAAPRGWATVFRLSTRRPADYDSLWYAACRAIGSGCFSAQILNALTLGIFLGAVGLVWHAKSDRDSDFPRWTLGFPIVALFLLTNKVYSPQYGLWLLPWFAVALPDRSLFLLFQIADVAEYALRFQWFARLEGHGGLPYAPLGIAVTIRAAVLVGCVAAWVARPTPTTVVVGPIGARIASSNRRMRG